jgi:L-fuconolactonase
MRIDAHQHFWVYNREEYSWISDSMKVLRRDFLPGDLLRHLEQLNIDGSIAVQARQSLDETRWLLRLAGEYDFIKGVVGWVDLCSGEAADQIAEFAADPKLVGIRHVLQDEPDDMFMLQESFLRGISLLKKFILVYELLIFPRHLPYALTLVKQFPGQQFVLDHIGKPLVKDKIISPWKEGIRELALQKNVSCKLSGIVTEAAWQGWSKSDFVPYLDVVFDSFGPERLMIGSDWPVCTLAADYESTLNIVTDFIGSKSEADRELIMGRNAERIYKLYPGNQEIVT